MNNPEEVRVGFFTKMWDQGKMRVKALTGTPSVVEAFRAMGSAFFNYPRYSQYVNGAYVDSQSATYGHIYSTQENVRIVVDTVARYVAKRALKCYDKPASGKRIEDEEFPANETLKNPNDFQAGRQLLKSFVIDKLVYEDAFLWDMGPYEDGRRFLIRVPPPVMGVSTDNTLKPIGYYLKLNNGQQIPLKTSEVIHWSGYSPDSNRIGVSKLETLRVMLTENAVRKASILDMIRGGLIKGGIVKRPIDAPTWSKEARRRFESSFADRLRGTTKGEVAMLEDGMDFMEAGITPREAEMLESKQYDLALCANIYGLNPSLFTQQGNLAQAREMLEEDVVTELVDELADVLTMQIIREIYQDTTHYFKFKQMVVADINTVFEAGSKGTGGSVMTSDEFRDIYLDLPPTPGGDQLVKNPGATTGSLPPAPGADPRGTPPPAPEDVGIDATVKMIEGALAEKESELKRKALDKEMEDHLRDKIITEHVAIFSKHFRRQMAAHQAGNVPFLNQKRWNVELADDLRAVARDVVQQRGERAAQEQGTLFDMVQVQNYLRAGAELYAKQINDVTANFVANQISKGRSVSQAYEDRVNQAQSLGQNRTTTLMSFAVMEAVRQSTN